MPIDENEFFRQATLEICGSLDMKTAMRRCLGYLEKVMPVSRISLHIYETGLGAIRTILLATRDEGREVDILSPLTPEMRDGLEKQGFTDGVVIERPRGDPVVVRIVNSAMGDSVTGLVSRQFRPPTDASVLAMNLRSDGSHLGVVVCGVDGKDVYSEEHAKLFSLLHDPFAIALSNALKHQEVLRLKDLLADDNRYLHRELLRLSGDKIIGSRSGLKGVMDMAAKVAHLDNALLLLGETGAGKDVIANSIHYSSPRKDGPFIKVNCGAIPETLIDSELFGHEKGAFTGATAQNRGCFERADRGTIFLDEIGELPPAAQVRMLRVIQYREIQRVGGTGPVPVDIRIIAATHRNLEEMVKAGTFREDLWFRLNVFPIVIPSLRDRKSDIPALVRHFIGKKAKELKLAEAPALARGAIDRLIEYDWPGNVRELENVVERALILSGSGPLTFDRLLPPGEGKDSAPQAAQEQIGPLDRAVSDYIRRALEAAKGRIHGPGGAAELLDMKPGTLRSKMKKLHIPFKYSR